MTATGSSQDDDSALARAALMRVCADATDGELSDAVAAFTESRDAQDLRSPEVGLVMLRGRIGGSGAPFNVGEITLARAVVTLPDGSTGYGYQMGRAADRARAAAIIDALGQNRERRSRLETLFVAPVRARVGRQESRVAAEVAATRVDFFTVARGED